MIDTSDSTLTALVTISGIVLTFLAVCVNAFVTLQTAKRAAAAVVAARAAVDISDKTDKKVDGLTINVDGRFTELLRVTEENARNAGKLQGHAEGTAEEAKATAARELDKAAAAATVAALEAAKAEGRLEGEAQAHERASQIAAEVALPALATKVEDAEKKVDAHEHDAGFHVDEAPVVSPGLHAVPPPTTPGPGSDPDPKTPETSP